MQDLPLPFFKAAIRRHEAVENQTPQLSGGKKTHDTILLLWLEISRSLVCTGLVTSALNLLSAHKETKCIDHVFRYLPRDTNMITAVARGVVQAGFDDATRSNLGLLAGKMKAARTSIERCKVFDGHCEDGDWRELEDVVLGWRKVCALGINGLCCLERVCNALWTPERLRALDKLIEFLGNARNGDSPYLGADGYPLVPHWAEHRQDRRELVNLGAIVHCDREVHDAIVTDIAVRGIGLDRIFGLRRGQCVAVELEDGRRLAGTVAWTAAGRAGVAEIYSPDRNEN